MKLWGQKFEQPQKIPFYAFFKINIYTVSRYKIILSTIYPNLWSCKALPGNMIYKMKVCLNIDVVFKPFEIVVLDNFHDKYLQQSKKKFYLFLFF